MKINSKTIKLYALPEELLGDNPTIVRMAVSLPHILPVVVMRSDANPLEKTKQLHHWFKENIELVQDGHLLVSAALPALSLDASIWPSVIDDLRDALSSYKTIEGPVYVASLGFTRSSLFAASDWYRERLHGSVMVAVAVVRQEVPVVATIDPDRVMADNHIVSKTVAEEATQ